MRCSATGAIAGSALTLLQVANLAICAPEKGGLGVSPYEVLDWAYSRPLRLLGLDPATFELNWAAARRRSQSSESRNKSGDVVAQLQPAADIMTVGWNEVAQAFQIVS